MLGRAASFSLKKYVVGAVALSLLFGAYKAYSDVSDWYDGIKQDRLNLATAKANNDKLKQEIETERSNNAVLSNVIDAERKRFDNYRTAQIELAEQQKIDQKAQDDLIEALKKEMENLPCAIEPIPDSVIRMHKQQWREGRARN